MWCDGGCANKATTCKPFAPSCHPERGNTAESRDLDRANRARARYEHAELFLAKKLLCAIEVQRFYLDPATASPCGLLARRSLASQTSTSLRYAQDDTDGMLIADGGGSKPRAFAKQKRRAREARTAALQVCTNIAATLAFPNAGCPRLRRARRYAALRQSREGGPTKLVDEVRPRPYGLSLPKSKPKEAPSRRSLRHWYSPRVMFAISG